MRPIHLSHERVRRQLCKAEEFCFAPGDNVNPVNSLKSHSPLPCAGSAISLADGTFATMKKTTKEFFPGISKISYEGPRSKNPLAFKHYNAEEVVEGKSMRDHLRFSVTYWHTIRGQLSDMFGPGTAVRPWEDGTNSLEMAETRVRVAFEFLEKLGAPFYAFHDRDVAPEGRDLRETNKNLDAIVKVLKAEQDRTGVRLLWGTACLLRIPALLTAPRQVATPTLSPTLRPRSKRPSR